MGTHRHMHLSKSSEHPSLMIICERLSNKTQDCTLLPSTVIHSIARGVINQLKLTWFLGLKLYKESNGTSKSQGKKRLLYKLQPTKSMLSSQEQQPLIFHQSITPFQKFLKGANLFLDSGISYVALPPICQQLQGLFCFSPPDLPLQYISCKLSNQRVTQFTEKVNKNLFLIL